MIVMSYIYYIKYRVFDIINVTTEKWFGLCIYYENYMKVICKLYDFIDHITLLFKCNTANMNPLTSIMRVQKLNIDFNGGTDVNVRKHGVSEAIIKHWPHPPPKSHAIHN